MNFGVLVCVRALTSSDMSGVWTDMAYAIGGAVVSAVLRRLAADFGNGVQPRHALQADRAFPTRINRPAAADDRNAGHLSPLMVVANLAEAAAEAVGANALLARVGAYYHDIGKLVRPMYFKENQMGENPHDKTDPRVSTAILTEHTRDGVELARKHRLPEPIIDMIRQHHGDTPVMYFLRQGGEDAGRGERRYPRFPL